MLTATVKLFLHKVGTDYAAEAQVRDTLHSAHTKKPRLLAPGILGYCAFECPADNITQSAVC